MPGWVEADTDIVLWLMIREGGPTARGVSDRILEIVGADLEVHHHLLVAGTSRPDRSNELGLGLERECCPAIRISQHHPIWLLRRDLPVQQRPVEASQYSGIGSADVDGR